MGEEVLCGLEEATRNTEKGAGFTVEGFGER
jgi:hypothetical protein